MSTGTPLPNDPRSPGAGGTNAAATSKDEPTPRHLVALETALRLAQAALKTLSDAPSTAVDIRPAAALLAKAVVSVARGFDGASPDVPPATTPTPVEAVRDAMVALAEAKTDIARAAEHDAPLLPLLDWIDNANGWLLVAEERHSRVLSSAMLPLDLSAAVGVPRIHVLARPPLRPFATAAPPLVLSDQAPHPASPDLPPARTFAEVDARLAAMHARAAERKAAVQKTREVREKAARSAPSKPVVERRPGFVEGNHTATSRARVVRDRARECLSEVGMLGVQRAPLLGDPWRAAGLFEARMLASIDALASLGSDGIAAVEELVIGAPAKDPASAFSAAMIAGCFLGRDTLAMAERVARHLGLADTEVARCFAAALKLVPHPDLPSALRFWATDPDPAMRAIAVEVLGYRGLLQPGELSRAVGDGDPGVRAVAVLAAGAAAHEELEAIVAQALEETDRRVIESALLAMVLGDASYAADRVEKHLSGPIEDRAIVHLALGAEARHADRIVERLEEGVTKPRAFAAGWVGSPKAFPALLRGLRGPDPEVAIACAFALERVTGANLPEVVDMPPEHIDVPGDVAEPDVGEPKPLARQLSDPRDPPSDGSPDRMTLPSIQYARWKAYLDRERQRFRADARYRRGQPFTPGVAFTELDRFAMLPTERRLLHWELVVRTGENVRFDPHDFVPLQEEALRSWGPLAYRASSMAGSFGRARRSRK